MKNNLRKSLFVGMAALGFVAIAGSASANQASAKSYAKVTSNQTLTTDASTRNVNVTGSSALYTKAGTLKGARLVASTSTLKGLSTAQTSKSNWRAYRVAETNRGSVYYKVVSFDGKYHGWIYGGKSTASFNGGLTSYDTFKTGTVTDDQKNNTYKIASVGTANDNKTVTYTAPAWTQYKIGRAITDSTPYKDATFKIDQTGTRTREGDTWVHITATDSKDSAANGWILESGLTKASSTTTDTSESTTPAFADITLNTSSTAKADGTTVSAANGDDLGKAGAFIYSPSTGQAMSINDAKATVLSLIKADNGQAVTQAQVTAALKKAGLDDFYVSYWDGGVVAGLGKKFVTNAKSIAVFGLQYEVWHYTFKNISGDLKGGSTNVGINYNVTKKKNNKVRLLQSPANWQSIFDSIGTN